MASDARLDLDAALARLAEAEYRFAHAGAFEKAVIAADLFDAAAVTLRTLAAEIQRLQRGQAVLAHHVNALELQGRTS